MKWDKIVQTMPRWEQSSDGSDHDYIRRIFPTKLKEQNSPSMDPLLLPKIYFLFGRKGHSYERS